MDAVAPLSCCGASKLAGERAIISSGCKYLIFRTCWVYGTRGNNFAKTMLHLARERETLNVVTDQIGAPTGADLIADVTALAIHKVMQFPELAGVYHLAASGEGLWYGYACHVIGFAQAHCEQLAVAEINPIEAAAYPTPARRPLNSRLNTQKLRDSFFLHFLECLGRF